ncbi:MAG: glycoside hydrolase family 88 protein [Lachnotalea sp.]
MLDGYTFHGNHNFAKALWGRGNCWITSAIPEFLSMVKCDTATKRFLVEALAILFLIEAKKQYR